jgi:mannobiose 2-epimerase
MAVLLVAPGLAAQATGPPGRRLTPELRAALGAEATATLRRHVLEPWYPRAVDREHGGYLSGFDAGWRPLADQRKMVVSQARHLWTTSRLSEVFPSEAHLLEAATHGFGFLRDVLWDREHGGFLWLVSRDGRVVPDADGRVLKQSYGQAFGIYGLAAYHDVTGDPAALRLAREAFLWLEDHAHDPEHGGYFNWLERDGTPLREGHAGDAAKDQNSSIHLLEAFTELYRVSPDALVRERLEELLVIIRDTLVVEPGTLTLFSHADWTPALWRDSTEAARRADNWYHDHLSFGHDIETAYLLLEAAEAVYGEPDERTLAVAKELADQAVRNGWDDRVGGLFDGAYPYPGPRGLEIVLDGKSWWAQAEALNTLLLMGDLHPADPRRYHDLFLRQWGYINGFLLDGAHGGFYSGGLDREPGARTAPKAHIWKAAYHDGRALMNVARRLAGGAAPPD